MNDTMPTLQERLQDANMKWGAILMWKGIFLCSRVVTAQH